MQEFIPGLCWQEFYTTNQLAVNALNNAGFKCLRIFFNLCDIPDTGITAKMSSDVWQLFIKRLFATMPNPLHAWTFEGHASVNTTTEPMRYAFDFCKKYGWLPIVCMGYQEELPHNWLGRNPAPDKWVWLGKFCKEFAIFLKSVYGFNRADLEVYNEPSKVFNWNTYCDLALIMSANWKTISNYKVHIFADDLLRTDYLNAILTRADLCNKIDYISTHIGVGSEDDEWDRGLVQITAMKIARYPHLKQALTEMSVNGTWSRLQQLPGNVAMYGIIGAIRNIEFGTATRIDDIWMWDRAGNLQTTSPQKAQILKDFNTKYYKPYILESEDMILQSEYKFGSKGMGVKFIQKVLNIETMSTVPLKIDGGWGALTQAAYEEYGDSYGVSKTIVDKKIFKQMIKDHPDIWDEINYSWAVGER